MSTISRRQKELLLNDVARMINNNNHTAFANHAKIAETVSNGDLKLFIDAPKKEFVIRYGKKEIRINCNEQSMKEISEIVFNNNSKLKGISDTTTLSSSTVALSTKGAQDIKESISTKADKQHNHDDKYAAKEHTHDNLPEHNHDERYATKTDLALHDHNEVYATKEELVEHNHTEYAPLKHEHTEYQKAGSYASSTHNHDTKYSKIDHTHYGIDDKDELKEFINDIAGDKWYNYLWEVLGIGVSAYDTAIIWHMQAQIKSIFAILAANGLTDTLQTTTGLGSALDGVANKLGDVADTVEELGDRFESIKGPMQKLSKVCKKGSEAAGKYSRLVDNALNCDNLHDMTEYVRRFNNGIDYPLGKLPKPTDVLDMNLLP